MGIGYVEDRFRVRTRWALGSVELWREAATLGEDSAPGPRSHGAA